jgi:hypothetical protein
MDVATVTAIIAALGGPVLIIKALDVIKATRSGRAAREKAENRSALGRLAAAEEERDEEADYRRRIEEWAGGIIYMVKTRFGVSDADIPPKPSRNRVNA